MKKLIIFFLFLYQVSLAQNIVVNSVKQLRIIHKDASYPTLSADGKLLTYSTSSYKGLYLYNFTTEKSTEITSADGAGYQPVITPDNTGVYFQKSEFVNNRKFASIQKYSIPENRTTQTEAPTRTLKAPAISGNKIIYKKNDELKSINTSSSPHGSKTKAVTLKEFYVTIENQKISLYIDGKKSVLSPAGVESYIWPSLSPDGKKLLAYAIGKGAFTCNLDGSSVKYLGELQAPVWYNDNIAVGMVAKDDGHVYTKSEIFAVDVDSKNRKNLAPSIPMAMYPTCSAASGKIAFSTFGGELYLINVSTY